jgi:hypothetical protein
VCRGEESSGICDVNVNPVVDRFRRDGFDRNAVIQLRSRSIVNHIDRHIAKVMSEGLQRVTCVKVFQAKGFRGIWRSAETVYGRLVG